MRYVAWASVTLLMIAWIWDDDEVIQHIYAAAFFIVMAIVDRKP
jgi:hypothetical protein